MGEKTQGRLRPPFSLKDISRLILWLDGAPLYLLGIVLAAVNFAPYFILGEGCIIPTHDQLDETILSYVLSAKYLGTGTTLFPEMLGGIRASGLQPSAVLFLPLYRFLPVLNAFLIQYGIVFAGSFLGMYFCVRKLTSSSILSLASAGCFCMLPYQPVYGMTVAAAPIALWCFLCLKEGRRIVLSLVLLVFLGLTSHLVLIGYVLLGFWALGLLSLLFSGKKRLWPWIGFGVLLVAYILVNRALFGELLLGNGGYVSHREEMVTYALPFWDAVRDLFLQGTMHTESLHRYLILPILLLLSVSAAGCIRRKKITPGFIQALLGFLLLVGIAVFYGFCKWEPVVAFKNSCSGFLRYFQVERFYYLYPSGWYVEFAVCCSLFWRAGASSLFQESGLRGRLLSLAGQPITRFLLLCLLMIPTLREIKTHSYLYMNVNQINNGSGITGYISWESFYSEDLMAELEQAIGRDMSTYRVAHLGMSPAPALLHGFYTADGYSNNYPLAYKHRFRQVIARELSKNEATRLYFDEWGSRCYLFNASSGTAWMLGKNQNIVYEHLDLDTGALRDLGCEYLFSCGEIRNAQELGLSLMGCYETESSYWRVWLYQVSALAEGHQKIPPSSITLK